MFTEALWHGSKGPPTWLIDLSALLGGSVNEGIDPKDAVWLIKAAGPGF